MNVLTNEQRSAFDEDGFVVLRGLLDAKTDLDPVIIEYEGVLDRLARRLVEAREIASTHEELPFERRLSGWVPQSSSCCATSASWMCSRI